MHEPAGCLFNFEQHRSFRSQCAKEEANQGGLLELDLHHVRIAARHASERAQVMAGIV